MKRLYLQRLRWQRGALENLMTYKVTRHTLPYIARQIMTYIGIAFVPFFVTTMVYTWMTVGMIPWSWIWLGVGAFVALERIWSVNRGGWKAILIAGLIFPEVIYDLFLHGVYVKSITDIATGARERWDHTTPADLVGARPWRRWWDRFLSLAFTAVPLTTIIAGAIFCVTIGIAWTVVGVLVAAGAAYSALRVSGLDPFGLLFRRGSGELSKESRRATRQIGHRRVNPRSVTLAPTH
jgi:biofilm PGA synthesis N-glycosyltransferase PgaC